MGRVIGTLIFLVVEMTSHANSSAKMSLNNSKSVLMRSNSAFDSLQQFLQISFPNTPPQLTDIIQGFPYLQKLAELITDAFGEIDDGQKENSIILELSIRCLVEEIYKYHSSNLKATNSLTRIKSQSSSSNSNSIDFQQQALIDINMEKNSEVTGMFEEIESLHNDKNKLIVKIKSLSADYQNNIMKEKEKIRMCEDKYQDSLNRLKMKDKIISNLETQLNEMNEDLHLLAVQIEGLKKKINKKDSKIQVYKLEVSKLKSTKFELPVIEVRNDNSSKELVNLRIENQRLNQTINELQQTSSLQETLNQKNLQHIKKLSTKSALRISEPNITEQKKKDFIKHYQIKYQIIMQKAPQDQKSIIDELESQIEHLNDELIRKNERIEMFQSNKDSQTLSNILESFAIFIYKLVDDEQICLPYVTNNLSPFEIKMFHNEIQQNIRACRKFIEQNVTEAIPLYDAVFKNQDSSPYFSTFIVFIKKFIKFMDNQFNVLREVKKLKRLECKDSDIAEALLQHLKEEENAFRIINDELHSSDPQYILDYISESNALRNSLEENLGKVVKFRGNIIELPMYVRTILESKNSESMQVDSIINMKDDQLSKLEKRINQLSKEKAKISEQLDEANDQIEELNFTLNVFKEQKQEFEHIKVMRENEIMRLENLIIERKKLYEKRLEDYVNEQQVLHQNELSRLKKRMEIHKQLNTSELEDQIAKVKEMKNQKKKLLLSFDKINERQQRVMNKVLKQNQQFAINLAEYEALKVQSKRIEEEFNILHAKYSENQALLNQIRQILMIQPNADILEHLTDLISTPKSSSKNNNLSHSSAWENWAKELVNNENISIEELRNKISDTFLLASLKYKAINTIQNLRIQKQILISCQIPKRMYNNSICTRSLILSISFLVHAARKSNKNIRKRIP